MKVCVIGCGGLGGYVVEILARIGVHHITVVDHDTFDVTNLNRQLFSTENVIGRSKVAVCVKRIMEVNSEVEISALECRLERQNAFTILKGHDVAVDALDTIKTRILLAESCKELGMPMVHGSIGGWYGQVATILPGDATLDLLYGSSDDKGIESEKGNLPFTASAVASFQCAEVIKLLTGKGELLSKSFMRIDLLNNDVTIIKL